MENLKYVSPEYQAQLERLAETLCTPERERPELTPHTYAQLALSATVEAPTAIS